MARYGPTVLRVCRAVLGPTAAEDAWSETFLAALRAYPELRADSNVEAWLVTIAHRKAIDHLRAESRRALPLGDLTAAPTRPACPGAGSPTCGTPARPPAPAASDRRLPLPGRPALRRRGPRPRREPGRARRAAADGIAALRRAYSDPEGDALMTAPETRPDPPDRPRRPATCSPRCPTWTPKPSAGSTSASSRRRPRPGSSTSPTAPSTPRSGSLLLAATEEGLVRVAYPGEDHDAVLARLAEPGQPAGAAGPRPPGRGRAGAGGVLRRAGAGASTCPSTSGCRRASGAPSWPTCPRSGTARPPATPPSPPPPAARGRCAPWGRPAPPTPCRWWCPATAWCTATAASASTSAGWTPSAPSWSWSSGRDPGSSISACGFPGGARPGPERTPCWAPTCAPT